ncbi:hypothetical protein FBZ84_12662 [Azospirillum baldaniorum]|uniref:hypothetical protein n=1 Tax=Azospirillum baldaniorum TaxID=1064539 RepID=UPI00119D9B80|nr:hypothetical protein [Azospirillum baldaniorum]TWA55423.1 hypothetical protein FBZ84_12662 [Azospirillum baldaniorum]
MTVYRKYDQIVSAVVALMAYSTRVELHAYDIEVVTKAARCYYWIELLNEEKVKGADVPSELVSNPGHEIRIACDLDDMSQTLMPEEQDIEIVRTVEDMHRHIRHIVVNREPREIEKMGPTDIVHAIIESDYAHIAELQEEIQVKLSTMPTLREFDAAWLQARHSGDQAVAEAV